MPRQKLAISVLLMWAAVFAAFAGYGFFGPGFEGQIHGVSFMWHVAYSTTLYYGGVGFSVATMLAAGGGVFFGVRNNIMRKWVGIVLLISAAAVAFLLPPTLMQASGLFRGETGMMIFFKRSTASLLPR